MIPNKLQIKVFARHFDDALVPAVIPVFHRWITERVLDEVLVDVADYRHVVHGPGITLIGHESTYHLDEQNGQRGLVCFRKRAFAPDRSPLLDALRRALFACAQLERELSSEAKLFDAATLKVSFADRTTTAFSLEACAARVAEELANVYASLPQVELARDGNLPAVHAHFGEAHSAAHVLERLTTLN